MCSWALSFWGLDECRLAIWLNSDFFCLPIFWFIVKFVLVVFWFWNSLSRDIPWHIAGNVISCSAIFAEQCYVWVQISTLNALCASPSENWKVWPSLLNFFYEKKKGSACLCTLHLLFLCNVFVDCAAWNLNWLLSREKRG